jgi:hypothetical protein
MAESPQKTTKAILTLDDAARLAGQEVTNLLSFKDYGDSVVIVTVAGEKLTVAKNAKS